MKKILVSFFVVSVVFAGNCCEFIRFSYPELSSDEPKRELVVYRLLDPSSVRDSADIKLREEWGTFNRCSPFSHECPVFDKFLATYGLLGTVKAIRFEKYIKISFREWDIRKPEVGLKKVDKLFKQDLFNSLCLANKLRCDDTILTSLNELIANGLLVRFPTSIRVNGIFEHKKVIDGAALHAVACQACDVLDVLMWDDYHRNILTDPDVLPYAMRMAIKSENMAKMLARVLSCGFGPIKCTGSQIFEQMVNFFEVGGPYSYYFISAFFYQHGGWLITSPFYKHTDWLKKQIPDLLLSAAKSEDIPFFVRVLKALTDIDRDNSIRNIDLTDVMVQTLGRGIGLIDSYLRSEGQIFDEISKNFMFLDRMFFKIIGISEFAAKNKKDRVIELLGTCGCYKVNTVLTLWRNLCSDVYNAVDQIDRDQCRSEGLQHMMTCTHEETFMALGGEGMRIGQGVLGALSAAGGCLREIVNNPERISWMPLGNLKRTLLGVLGRSELAAEFVALVNTLDAFSPVQICSKVLTCLGYIITTSNSIDQEMERLLAMGFTEKLKRVFQIATGGNKDFPGLIKGVLETVLKSIESNSIRFNFGLGDKISVPGCETLVPTVPMIRADRAVPAVTVPAVTVPAVTVPAVPAVTVPAVTVPAATVPGSWLNSDSDSDSDSIHFSDPEGSEGSKDSDSGQDSDHSSPLLVSVVSSFRMDSEVPTDPTDPTDSEGSKGHADSEDSFDLLASIPFPTLLVSADSDSGQ